MGYDRTNRLRDVMADPAARRVLNAHLDGLVDELPIFSVITSASPGLHCSSQRRGVMPLVTLVSLPG